MGKTLKMLLGLLIALSAIGYGTLLWLNNRPSPNPSKQDIEARWERSVAWLLANRQVVLKNDNPVLWWMIKESGRLTKDSRLQGLFDEFSTGISASAPNSEWQIYFSPERYREARLPEQATSRLPDYQQFFLFNLTCSQQFASKPVIEAQHETAFCSSAHPLTPACVTHQLMGFRLAQRTGCGRVKGLPEKISLLQHSIRRQLTWDPRVVDVYLQRVLMLVDSGAVAHVKPRWLERVLAAQLTDGSWANFQPLLPLGDRRSLGFNSRLLGIGQLQGSVHSTVQGLWLLSLLRQETTYQALGTEE